MLSGKCQKMGRGGGIPKCKKHAKAERCQAENANKCKGGMQKQCNTKNANIKHKNNAKQT